MPDTDFTTALEEASRQRVYCAEVYRLLRGAAPQWLPEVGECFNITIKKDQRDALIKALGWR